MGMISLSGEYRLVTGQKSIAFVLLIQFDKIPLFVRDDSSFTGCHFERSEKSLFSAQPG